MTSKRWWRDVREGDREAEVEGCFTCGAVGGQGVRVHMCVRDRMRKTKIET